MRSSKQRRYPHRTQKRHVRPRWWEAAGVSSVSTQYEMPFKLSMTTFQISIMTITPAMASHKARHPSCNFLCLHGENSDQNSWLRNERHALSADYRMLFAGGHRLMGVVNAHQCSNCDLHLDGDNLTKIVASFCRAFFVMKDNVERMWSITGSRTSAQRRPQCLRGRTSGRCW